MLGLNFIRLLLLYYKRYTNQWFASFFMLHVRNPLCVLCSIVTSLIEFIINWQTTPFSLSVRIFSSLHKAMHIGSNPSLDHGYHHHHHGGHSVQDSRMLTKAFFRDILSAHYRQPDLKVKINKMVELNNMS